MLSAVRTALVVDSCQTRRLAVASSLHRAGWRTVEAATPLDAICALTRVEQSAPGPIRLVLIAQEVHGARAADLLAFLRDNYPVATRMLIADAEPGPPDQRAAAIANAVLVAPCSASALGDVVTRAFDDHAREPTSAPAQALG